MEKVVYLLGAGFSAPLGLPVMSNFLVRSKDLFAAQPDKYPHFEDVFKTIGNMHVCKSYFEADLFNIEEILSILEMREGLEGKEVPSFVRYVADVVRHFTPKPKSPPRTAVTGGAWLNSILGNDSWAHCGAFVTSLFNLRFQVTWPDSSQPGEIEFAPVDKPKVAYSVVTLNYDLVLEDVCSFLNEHHPSDKLVSFQKDFTSKDAGQVPLAKLHGSADSGEIISPTWNKRLHRDLVPVWKKAHELISEANHLRILGYSLPTSDAYIRYLLKSAVVDAPNLKTIDVVCRGEPAKQHYEDFVRFNFYRFKQAGLEDYFAAIYRSSLDFQHFGTERTFDKLEFVHEEFMSS